MKKTLLSFFLVSFSLTTTWCQLGDTLKAKEYITKAGEKWNGEQYEESITYFEKAINIYKAAGDWTKTVQYQMISSNRLLLMNQLGRAFTTLSSALETANSKLGEKHPMTADVHKYFGKFYFEKREWEQAMIHFQKALELKIALFGENSSDAANLYNNIGVIYGYKGDKDKQLYNLQKALDIRYKNWMAKPDDAAVQVELGSTYNNLADVYKKSKDRDMQLNYLQKALNLWIKAKGNKHEYVAKAYSNLGSYYHDLGNYATEEQFLNKAIEVRRELYGETNVEIAKTYDKLAACLERKPDLLKAKEYYEKSLNLRIELYGVHHPDVGVSYLNLANYHLKNNNLELALSLSQKALFGFVNGFEQEDPNKNPKIKSKDISFNLLDAFGTKALAMRMIFERDKNEAMLNNAYTTLNLALTLIDSSRYSSSDRLGSKEAAAALSAKLYESAIETAYQLYNLKKDNSLVEEAFSIAERSKAFRLLSSLRDLDAKSYAGVPDSLIRRENKLKSEIYDFQKRLDEARLAKDEAKTDSLTRSLSQKNNELSNWIARIEKEFPKYFALKYQGKTATFKDVQSKLLYNGEVLLEYFAGEKSLYVFALSKNSVQMFNLGNSPDVMSKVGLLRKNYTDFASTPALAADQFQSYTDLSRLLYRTLIEPALANIPKPRKLFVVPDGQLGLIPVETFLTSDVDPSMMDFTQLPYLIREFPISYSYSATLRIENVERTSRSHNSKCLAFAPTYEGAGANASRESGDFGNLKKDPANLPGTLREIKSISNFFPGSYFYGPDATKKRFMDEKKDFNIIHLAMHGIANSGSPWLSYLRFANDSLNESSLYAYELTGEELNADLVVLSACETGFGRFETGEGIGSLARGFMSAGTPSVLMTLWKVNDQASSELITKFYEGLSKGMDKDEALQFAKLEYIKGSTKIAAHPYYWAGFVEYGDVQPLTKRRPWMWWMSGGIVAILAGVGIRKMRSRRSA